MRSVSLKELCSGVTVRRGSKRHKEIVKFIEDHQTPAPVKIPLVTKLGKNSKLITYQIFN